jgi:hypothetical protein
MTQEPARSWWGRNWKWFIPVGCLSMLLLFVGGIAVIMTLTFGMMKSSDAYGLAMARAQASPEVRAALGEPIQAGYMVSGRVNVSGPAGDANMSIPLSGPRGSGTLYLVAEKSAGQWRFEELVLEVEASGARIDLNE